MRFLEKVQKLTTAFPVETCRFEENASFYGLHPNADSRPRHIVFQPMTEETVNNLVASYRGPFPKDLLHLYRHMNGFALFWTTISLSRANIVIPYCLFSLYGVPPEPRRYTYQPYNIRIEDLAKPNHSPDSWLKFGSYHPPYDIEQFLELYIDTDTQQVYSVDKANPECCILQQWDSLDDCLCSVFDQLAEAYPTMSGVDAL